MGLLQKMLLPSMMGTSIVQAYTLSFTNSTDKAANFEVRYAGETSLSCRKDQFTLQPGEKKDIGTGLCCWRKIRCTGDFSDKEVTYIDTCRDWWITLDAQNNLLFQRKISRQEEAEKADEFFKVVGSVLTAVGRSRYHSY